MRDDDELLDIKEACRFLGGTRPIHPATLFRGMKDGRFPKAIKIGPQTSRWRKSSLKAAIERLAGERS